MNLDDARTSGVRVAGPVRWLTLAATAALFAAPAVASAQAFVGRAPKAYAPLSSPTIIATSTDDSSDTVNPPFPIRFYDSTFTSMTVGSNGAILFPGGQVVSPSNPTPGAAASPNA